MNPLAPPAAAPAPEGSRQGVLAALESATGHVSGAALAATLGISRAAVWKHIEALRKAGWTIESARVRGYRLVAAPAGLSEAAIQARCGSGPLGRRVMVLQSTGSTNSDAMELGRRGEPEGTVVIAEEQTAGRGRLGRAWESSRGVNLYLSVLLRPLLAPWKAPQLSLVAGVAVAETVREEGVDARIKWPNDIVTVGADGSLHKLSGLLTEIEAEAERVSFVVVGIGVNLNSTAAHFSTALQSKATSVLLERGSPVDRTAFAARLIGRLGEAYDAWRQGGFAAVAPRWRALAVLEGRRVDVDAPGERWSGTCVGIDDDGALLLQGSDASGALRRVLAGDVTLADGYGGQ